MTLRRCVIAATAAAAASLGGAAAFSLTPTAPTAKLSLGKSRAAAGRAAPLRMSSAEAARTAKSAGLTKYCDSVSQTQRRKTSTVIAGNVKIGSEHPIALQTMTTAMTTDVEGSIDQVMRCADAGADLVRLTVQGQREADAASKIKEGLLRRVTRPRSLQTCTLRPRLRCRWQTHSTRSGLTQETLPMDASRSRKLIMTMLRITRRSSTTSRRRSRRSC